MSALQDIMSLIPHHKRDTAITLLTQVKEFKLERDQYLLSVSRAELFEIETTACRMWSCNYDDYRGKSRIRSANFARVFMYQYLYRYARWTQEAIGRYFNRDHATVHHGLDTFSNMHDTDKYFRAKFAEFIESITNPKTEQNDQQRPEVSQSGADATAVPTDVLTHRTVNH